MGGKSGALASGTPATGGLAGSHPDIGLSARMAAIGAFRVDDFREGFGGVGMPFGEWHWDATSVAGLVATVTDTFPATQRERGVVRLTSPATASAWTVCEPPGVECDASGSGPAGLPVGWEMLAKVRAPTPVGALRAFVGLRGTATNTTVPASGNVWTGIGFRAFQAVSPNWFGVLKNGAGAETALDLGVAIGSAWSLLGVRRTVAGFQFFTATSEYVGGTPVISTTTVCAETDVDGVQPTTNDPTGPLAWQIGIGNSAALARALDLDLVATGGVFARL
jgi:hypothetical protein